VGFQAASGSSGDPNVPALDPTLTVPLPRYPRGCPADKQTFFTWLSNPLQKMALDIATTHRMVLTVAAKEGGWTEDALKHNMPLSNPFGVNTIVNRQAAGNKDYTTIGGLPKAISEWERMFKDRVYGEKDPQNFVYKMQHPAIGQPYNSAHADKYEDVFMQVYNSMGTYMGKCGVQ
jgi:hypothetical protein